MVLNNRLEILLDERRNERLSELIEDAQDRLTERTCKLFIDLKNAQLLNPSEREYQVLKRQVNQFKL